MKTAKPSDPPVLTEVDLKRICEESDRLYAAFTKRVCAMHDITPADLMTLVR